VLQNLLRQEREEAQHSVKRKAINPLKGHEIGQAQRTKMVDWMVEVCQVFGCSRKTYFMAQELFDKFLALSHLKLRNGLKDTEVHLIGTAAMYLASKYEDVMPLSSKVVSEKIAHGCFAREQVLEMEAKLLNLFDFDLHFLSLYDVLEAFVGAIEHNFQSIEEKALLGELEEVTEYLLKMQLQSTEFLAFSHSHLVLSCLFSSVSILKSAKKEKLCEKTIDKFNKSLI